MSGGNADLCAKALRSLRRAAADCDAMFLPLAEAARLWAAAMTLHGLRPLTILRYLESVRSLFNKAGIPFTFATPLPSADTPERPVLPALRRLAERSARLASPLRLASDAFLIALYAGGISLEEVVGLRLDSNATHRLRLIPQAKEIIDRYAAPRRKYLLPLSQGRQATATISAELLRRLSAIFPDIFCDRDSQGGRKGSDASGKTAGHIGGIALRLAIDAGLTVREAADFTRQTVAGLVEPREIEEEKQLRLLRIVADAVSDPYPRWYAMRMRRGITPEQIAERLAQDSLRPKEIRTYYPCEEIARRVGKKLTASTRAYIADVLFFRSDPAGVLPLFRRIGDLAWCYRTSPDPSSPYAAISDRDMRAFQRRIGQFTDDIEIAADTETPDFSLGQQVRIASGPMAGYEGRVLTLPQGNRRMLRLAVTADRGLLLTLTIPSPALRPL